MGRLCGGAHEISGIPAPLWFCGWWLEGTWGGWVVVWMVGAGGLDGVVDGVLVRGGWVGVVGLGGWWYIWMGGWLWCSWVVVMGVGG